jgi:predicted cupin superfamily sugar epimerase
MPQPETQAQAQELIERLGLLPHPEGGYYRETYRSTTKVATPRGERCASTAILFLLTAGQCSHWHRICADELWLHQGGGGLLIHELSPAGAYRRTRLGLNLTAGETPQHLVPAGHWFGSEPAAGVGWSLVGCTVAPGFEFVDFSLARPEDLAPIAAACPDWRRLCLATEPQVLPRLSPPATQA